ncbi:MAG: DUF4238 domain-containing protein [Acetobacteraceae bacterium]
MTARRHHYVPQCYLKGFCPNRAKPKLFAIDIRRRQTFTASPVNVAAQRDFHTVEIDGLPADALENQLARFESDLSHSLSRIIEARSIAAENDRINLLKLIAILAVKNPRLRTVFGQFQERLMKMVLQLVTATPERWESQLQQAKDAGYFQQEVGVAYEQIRDFVDRDEYDVRFSTTHHLVLELSSVDKVLPVVFARKWLLFRAPRGVSGFITSDHPVCLMWRDPKRRGGPHPPGYGLRGTQIVFPISNDLAMIGGFEFTDTECNADERQIAEINTTIIAYADQQIYARDREFRYLSPRSGRIMRGAEVMNDSALMRAHRVDPA